MFTAEKKFYHPKSADHKYESMDTGGSELFHGHGRVSALSLYEPRYYLSDTHVDSGKGSINGTE